MLPANQAAGSSGHSILAAASAFGSLPMWSTNSREGSVINSRTGTPQPSGVGSSERQGRSVAFAEPDHNQAQQQRFGVKLGRLFGGRDARP